MTESDFMTKILGNARQLCTPEAEKDINQYKHTISENVSDYDGDAAKWDAMFLSEGVDDNKGYSEEDEKPMPMMPSGKNNSKMPSFIKNSMMSEQIDVSKLSDNPLDRIDMSKYVKPQRKKVQESASQPQQIVNNGVDYTIIKAIINECLDAKLSAFSKQPLNEGSTLKTIGLKEGKIRLIDNKGNIFSAQLEKVGNVNER